MRSRSTPCSGAIPPSPTRWARSSMPIGRVPRRVRRVRRRDRLGVGCQRAHMQVPGPSGLRPPTANEHEMRSLDVARAADQALLTTFKSRLTAEGETRADLDESPDEHIVVALDADGVAAYASQTAFGPAEQFATSRSRLVPTSTVMASGTSWSRGSATSSFAGMHPLYRRDVANTGSVRLCSALGFVPVHRSLRLPPPLTCPSRSATRRLRDDSRFDTVCSAARW